MGSLLNQAQRSCPKEGHRSASCVPRENGRQLTSSCSLDAAGHPFWHPRLRLLERTDAR